MAKGRQKKSSEEATQQWVTSVCEWVASDSGQNALAEALKCAEDSNARLREASKVDEESLTTPMTY